MLASILDNHYAKHADKLRMTILKISNDEEIDLEDVVSTDKNVTILYVSFYVPLLFTIAFTILMLFPKVSELFGF